MRARVTSDERWSHALDVATFSAAAQQSGTWTPDRWPELDRVVRQICGREVGIALSVGAAAGLAHLGLLEKLEDAGVPMDFLCGSSMGGAVSMAFAYFGNARAAADAVCRLAADFARSKGMQWLPRAGLVSPGRMDAICGELFGRAEFSELRVPVAVVAADLVAGRRVVLDTGSLALAARATAAIPGLFPPVRLGDAVLVDGGLVTRVPADLLATRRIGLRLAALVEPERAGDATPGHATADAFEARLDRPFGLRTALGASWSLLGWWDSAAQAERADVVVRIPTPSSDGFNFRAAQTLIDYGRRAAESHLSAIHAAVTRVLSPGAP
jgi:NTE family protein